IRRAFDNQPTKLTAWSTQFEKMTMKPDISIAGRSKLTFIPTPRDRKSFLRDLITYYANILTLNDKYNDYVDYINNSIVPYKSLFAEIEKTPGKNLGEKIKAYMSKSISGRSKAITQKKAEKFLLLVDGSIHRSFIVPFDLRYMVCPTDVNYCACDKSVKVKKGEPCVRKCNDKCQDYEKSYKFQNKEFSFNPAINKKLPFSGARVALKFETIAPRSLNWISQHEIMVPVQSFLYGAKTRFNEIHNLIKKTEGLPGKILKTLGDASNRKKRGII
ncbi:hypothetical protein KKF84_10620, partial [Myxococcota bacterium]|nr:hypothetical protein [Myxococcota bacterium]